ncbi:MAG TPA: LPS assembly protein LptD [Terriglobales bacterium]|jgi:LPS-assembly protein|nr:LPS assembly protein LptD [Terriglobales bacterium]
MSSRTRFLITATFVCHLILAVPLVTSQLLSPNTAQELPNTRPPVHEEDVTITALQQEKQGTLYQLHGNVEIHYGTYILRADEVSYNSATGDSKAAGHVVLDGGPNDEHIEASRGTYNLRSEIGRFENVTGSIGMQLHGRRLMLTSSNPFVFTGAAVEKNGPDHFKVYDGVVTTCNLPRPKWDFHAHEVVVEVGGTAKIYHSTFAIEGIPMLYFPFATLPAQTLPRQTGFLIPNLGYSSTKGVIFGESVFWAINRSMDAHIGAEYFSKRGWAPQGEFRARPSDNSFVDLNYFSVLDRGIGDPHVDQGGEEVHLTAEGQLPHNFRGVADIDYLSSFIFRLAFSDTFTQAVNSEVKSDAFLSNASHGFFYNFSVHRYQDFESSTSGDVITIFHAPGVELSSVDQPLGRSPFYWSYDAALEGLSRSDPASDATPAFSTAPLVGRFDFSPDLSLPLRWGGWSFRPEISVRDTDYTQYLRTFHLQGISNDERLAISANINRKYLDASFEVRPPALSRVFGREFLGRKWKHVIEPRGVYTYVTGVSNFANILRFDQRDILSNTDEVGYSVVQRLYAKRTSGKTDCGQPGIPALFIGGAPPRNPVPWERQQTPVDAPCEDGTQVREVVTWELAQKYFLNPTFGGALSPGRSNVLTSTVDLTGIAFLSSARHLSPLISRLRIQTSSRTDVEWDMDYDFTLGHMTASTVLVNYRLGPFTLGGGDAFLQVPPEAANTSASPSPQSFNQFRLLLGYGHTGKQGFSAATNIGFDADLGFLQYAAVQATYNWDCCGFNVEFRRFDLGSVRNENQYRFTFALANLGSLGNLRRAERLF